MIEAAKTTATTGEVWVICVVAVVCLAFWLAMVAWADRNPVGRGRRVPDMRGPVLGGMHVAGGGRSVSPNRDAPPVLTDADDLPYDQPQPTADRPPRAELRAEGGMPGRVTPGRGG